MCASHGLLPPYDQIRLFVLKNAHPQPIVSCPGVIRVQTIAVLYVRIDQAFDYQATRVDCTSPQSDCSCDHEASPQDREAMNFILLKTRPGIFCR